VNPCNSLDLFEGNRGLGDMDDGKGTPEHSCFYFPGWVSNVPQMPFIYLQVQMLIIFVVNQVLHRLFFQHIGMPPLVSELLVGALSFTLLCCFSHFQKELVVNE